jgi:histidyl-tRNA synthetase
MPTTGSGRAVAAAVPSRAPRPRRQARLRTPLGTADVLPAEAALRDEIEATARRIFTAAGYVRIDTPAFEATDLFVRGVGESTDIVTKQMYNFADDHGRPLTLRPEGTAAICRAYVQHGLYKLPQPLRLWFHGSYFRQETPQAGRFRQFTQLGVETVGSDDPAIDAESMLLLTELFEAMGITGLLLRVSSLGMPESRARYRQLLLDHLRAHRDELSADVRARIELNPLRAFDSRHAGTVSVMATAPRLLDHLDDADREHLREVLRLLDLAGVGYKVDDTLVRGLDYYTRTVFEFSASHIGAQSAIGGGGRFNRLVEQLGGPPAGACGGCAGVERLMLAMPDRPAHRPRPDLYVAFTDDRHHGRAFQLAADARRAGLAAQQAQAGRSLANQLRAADRAGARYVAVLRDDGARLKDMESGRQEPVEPGHVIAAVAARLDGGTGQARSCGPAPVGR